MRRRRVRGARGQGQTVVAPAAGLARHLLLHIATNTLSTSEVTPSIVSRRSIVKLDIMIKYA